jgi:hypothetical protein
MRALATLMMLVACSSCKQNDPHATGTPQAATRTPYPVVSSHAAEPPARQPGVADPPSANVQPFLAWIASHRSSLQTAGSDPPECEANGLCATSDDYEVHYYKVAPSAARFSGHFPAHVGCEDLHAATVKTWGESAGFMGASGSRCDFAGGPLKGLSALIENNRDASGFNAGIHVYSSDYLRRDTDFAGDVRTDEAKAR